MATGYITVTVVDEGYFRKVVGIKPHMNIKKLVEKYCANLSSKCSNLALLEFWCEATRLDDQTAKMLEMQDGDVGDVRISEQSIRGACPLSPEQTLPNIHYLVDANAGATAAHSENAIREPDEALKARQRITFSIRNQNGHALTLTMKKTKGMGDARRAFCRHVRQRYKDLRFLTDDGHRIIDSDTPESIEMEDGDQIHVFSEQTGGASSHMLLEKT